MNPQQIPERIKEHRPKQTGRFIDFHTHILPGMDDGSKSLTESLAMLELSVIQGVYCAALTPHFYADKDTPERFFEKRKKSLYRLKAGMNSPMPLLIPGAEVQYFSGIAGMEEIRRFCLEKTDLFLLEMPFKKWSAGVIEEVLALKNHFSLQLVIAHIERYMQYQDKGVIDMLGREGILFQSNADFFINRFSRRKAIRMLKKGQIHLIGSDCHNLTTRPQQLGECYQILQEKLGEEAVYDFVNNSTQILLQKRKRSG